MIARKIAGFAVVALLMGCPQLQVQVATPKGPIPKRVCIAQHDAVNPEVLKALQEGFGKHGITTNVVPGSYRQLHGYLWRGRVEPAKITGCEAVVFYVAHWHWDLVLYMTFARIWMTTPDDQQRLRQATFSARASRFIDARDTILDLVDRMIGGS
jgi:hypothetical protein